MKEEKGQEPVFPQSEWVLERCGDINFDPMGMSKRFYAATKAMQGMLSNHTLMNDTQGRFDVESMVKDAYKCADELLKQE